MKSMVMVMFDAVVGADSGGGVCHEGLRRGGLAAKGIVWRGWLRVLYEGDRGRRNRHDTIIISDE